MTRPGPGSWRRDLGAAAPGWVAARAIVALAVLLADAVAGRWVPGAQAPLTGQGLLAWDGAFYRDLATVGYGGLPPEALRFFPLYPLLGRVLGGPGGHQAAALLLVANGAALVAAAMLHRLARLDTGDDALAGRAAWLVSLFPTAFVLVWGYAEAVYLVAAVGAFLAARSRRWGWAAVAGAAAALTRPVGVLLAVPLAIEAWRAWRGAESEHPGRALVAAAAPIAGLAAFLVWVGRTFGDPWAPFTVQSALRGEANPLLRLARGVSDLFGPERFGDGLHLPFALLFLALLVVVARRLPASYTAYAALVLVVALSADNLNSLERYALNAFPLLVGLAAVTGTQRRERLALAVCGGGLLALTALAWLAIYVP